MGGQQRHQVVAMIPPSQNFVYGASRIHQPVLVVVSHVATKESMGQWHDVVCVCVCML